MFLVQLYVALCSQRARGTVSVFFPRFCFPFFFIVGCFFFFFCGLAFETPLLLTRPYHTTYRGVHVVPEPVLCVLGV